MATLSKEAAVARDRIVRMVGGTLAVVVAVAVLAACGDSTGVDIGGPGGSGAPPGPSVEPAPAPDLDAALAKWAKFPVSAEPRPIVGLDDLPAPVDGFATDAAKLAFLCRQIDVAIDDYPDTPDQVAVRWADGSSTTHKAISAADVVARIEAAGVPKDVDCSGVQPVRLTGVSLGTAALRTDRGVGQADTWLFTGPGVAGDGLGYPALHPDEYWTVPVELRAGQLPVVAVSADGRALTVYFYGTPTDAGACTSEYEARFVESATAVAVAIRTVPPAQPAPTDVVCPEIAQLRMVEVELTEPLSGRVVVDETGALAPVCPVGRVDTTAGPPSC
ncbi:MAG: hypothetical protein L0Y54_03180 [Sporichthyaceae bacterium]|nr:hypothetical protein [Sporichthyaceae bacterium]